MVVNISILPLGLEKSGGLASLLEATAFRLNSLMIIPRNTFYFYFDGCNKNFVASKWRTNTEETTYITIWSQHNATTVQCIQAFKASDFNENKTQ